MFQLTMLPTTNEVGGPTQEDDAADLEAGKTKDFDVDDTPLEPFLILEKIA